MALIKWPGPPMFLTVRPPHPRRPQSEEAVQGLRIFWRMGVVIVVEIYPGTICPAALDPVRPFTEFLIGVVVPVPALRAVQTDIDLLRRHDELVREARSAAGTEYNSGFAKSRVNFLVPPGLMPEFHDIAAGGVELAHDRIQTGFAVAVAWRQLEEKAAHLFAENVAYHAKISDQRFSAFELFDVRDELANLHRVNDVLAARLTAPRLNARNGRP